MLLFNVTVLCFYVILFSMHLRIYLEDADSLKESGTSILAFQQWKLLFLDQHWLIYARKASK